MRYGNSSTHFGNDSVDVIRQWQCAVKPEPKKTNAPSLTVCVCFALLCFRSRAERKPTTVFTTSCSCSTAMVGVLVLILKRRWSNEAGGDSWSWKRNCNPVVCVQECELSRTSTSASSTPWPNRWASHYWSLIQRRISRECRKESKELDQRLIINSLMIRNQTDQSEAICQMEIQEAVSDIAEEAVRYSFIPQHTLMLLSVLELKIDVWSRTKVNVTAQQVVCLPERRGPANLWCHSTDCHMISDC